MLGLEPELELELELEQVLGESSLGEYATSQAYPMPCAGLCVLAASSMPLTLESEKAGFSVLETTGSFDGRLPILLERIPLSRSY